MFDSVRLLYYFYYFFFHQSVTAPRTHLAWSTRSTCTMTLAISIVSAGLTDTAPLGERGKQRPVSARRTNAMFSTHIWPAPRSIGPAP